MNLDNKKPAELCAVRVSGMVLDFAGSLGGAGAGLEPARPLQSADFKSGAPCFPACSGLFLFVIYQYVIAKQLFWCVLLYACFFWLSVPPVSHGARALADSMPPKISLISERGGIAVKC